MLQFYDIISNFSCTPVTQLAKMFKPWRPWLVKRLWPLTTFCTWNFWPSLKRISLPREATKTELFLNLWILDGNCWGFSPRKCSKEFQQAFWPNIIPEIQSINKCFFFKTNYYVISNCLWLFFSRSFKRKNRSNLRAIVMLFKKKIKLFLFGS